ncbi:hypothetical protein [Streptomyces sp. NPDC051636]|uniref:hypothetical protein n=1 Tax=Streptomyces sp. NPDC051636 TaxID=3365663 RepID=UPI0037AFCDA2
MTAEHDGYDGYDGSDGYEGPEGPEVHDADGLDALMAVLTERTLSGEARADTSFMAEHRAVTADVALLREQLGILGDTLAGPVPKSRPVPQPTRPRERWYRHPGVRAVSFGTLVTAAVALAVLGLGWLVAANSGVNESSGGSADKSVTSESSARGPALGCARLLVEGDVTKVRRNAGTDEDRVTLRVTRSYVPEKGEAEVSFLVERESVPEPEKGQHVLAGVQKGATNPDIWLTDTAEITRERTALAEELTKAGTRTCE